jgi:hypothetical protein
MREISNSHKILVRRTEGKMIFKEGDIDWNNIKTDIRDVEWQGVDWIYLAQRWKKLRADVSKVMKIRVPTYGMNF